MRPCRNCGSEPYLEKLIVSSGVKYYVRCRMCGQQVGLYGSKNMRIEQAKREWNIRQEER